MSYLVFAYGSNLCRERMLHRIASARPASVGMLRGYQLMIHKRGIDGSAKANACYTGQPDHVTWGAVYRIAKKHKPVLDRIEFVGVGYDTIEVDIAVATGESVRAWTYVARSAAISESLKPYAWYQALIVHGARQHRLPNDYVRRLEAIEATSDLDAARRRRNLGVIET